jgi:alpha-tubulin suppressor-like RCC1 family protein
VLITKFGERINVVYTWGEGSYLQLGHGDNKSRFLPTMVVALNLADIMSISCGGFHTLGVSHFKDISPRGCKWTR